MISDLLVSCASHKESDSNGLLVTSWRSKDRYQSYIAGFQEDSTAGVDRCNIVKALMTMNLLVLLTLDVKG